MKPKRLGKRRKCKHNWEQIDKEYYVTDDGIPAKRLIDSCTLCGKERTR